MKATKALLQYYIRIYWSKRAYFERLYMKYFYSIISFKHETGIKRIITNNNKTVHFTTPPMQWLYDTSQKLNIIGFLNDQNQVENSFCIFNNHLCTSIIEINFSPIFIVLCQIQFLCTLIFIVMLYRVSDKIIEAFLSINLETLS